MKITDVRIDGFGTWSGLELQDLSDRMTVFYGPNEAGKTTLLDFIRSVLFGFSPARAERYLPPHSGGRAGGALQIALPDGIFEVRRDADAGGPSSGTLTVLDGKTAARGSGVLAGALQQVDEATFNNVFAVGLPELQRLATLNDVDAAKWLYRIAAGLDVSLADVMGTLRASRQRLVADGDGPCQIASLLAERRQRLAAAAETATRMDRWAKLSQGRLELAREIADLKARLVEDEREVEVLERAGSVKDAWNQRATLRGELARLDDSVTLPDGSIQRLDALNHDIDELLRQRQELKQEYLGLRGEAHGLNINRALWRETPRIEALGEQLDWMASLEQQQQRVEAELAEHQRELDEEARRLGLDRSASSWDRTEVAKQAMVRLREPVRELRAARARLEAAEKQQCSCQEAATAAARKLQERRGSSSVEGNLATTVEHAGHQVARLSRRIAVDARIDQLRGQQGELEEQSCEVMEQQLLPFGALLGTGALFILGGVLMLVALWFPATVLGAWGRTFAVLGVLGMATSGVVKFLLERSEEKRLENCRRQLDLIGKQISQARQDRDELDKEIPVGGGPLASRLQEAERELAALEELLPLDAQWRAAEREAQRAAEQVREAEQILASALDKWRSALALAGLPEDLSPRSVRDLAAAGKRFADLRAQTAERERQFDGSRRQYEALAQRMAALAESVATPLSAKRPASMLEDLLRLAREQQPRIERRRGLRRRARQIRRTARQHASSIRQLRQQRDALVAEAGVQTEAEYRRLALQAARLGQLRAECATLDRQIESCPGVSEDELAAVLDSFPSQSLVERVDQARQTLAERRARLEGFLAEQGAVGQELEQLAKDRSGGQAQLELAVVQHKLQHAVTAWRVQSTTWLLLEEVRRRYEREYQPETLTEASGTLRELTEGRYTRVWTPLDEDVLLVDTGRGDSLPVDALSCGTREQLLLSLRLALVAFYARRGTCLPLVLDDVLVNFDTRRARLAARVLNAFAEAGHQVLLLTCHEHIYHMFQDLRVDVRQLPGSPAVPRREEPAAAAPTVAADAAESHLVDEPWDEEEQEDEAELVEMDLVDEEPEYEEEEDAYEEDEEEEEEDVFEEDEDEDEEAQDDAYEEEEDECELVEDELAAEEDDEEDPDQRPTSPAAEQIDQDRVPSLDDQWVRIGCKVRRKSRLRAGDVARRVARSRGSFGEVNAA